MFSRASFTTLIAGAALGACATAAATSTAADPEPTTGTTSEATTPVAAVEGATVIALESAQVQVAPSGKARITHLARGTNAYVGKLELDGDAAVPEHRDATEEFIHVLSGSGTITIEGQMHELVAGSTVYMPANAQVSFQNGPEPMVGLQVFAGPEPSAKYEGWTPG